MRLRALPRQKGHSLNVDALRIAIVEQTANLEAEGKSPKYVRMTCEQHSNIARGLYKVEDVTQPASDFKFNGLTVVKRGSLLDCQLREAKPKIPHIDLTKVEGQ